MSGINFFTTRDLEKIEDFYLNELEMELWLDQGECSIFKHGNMLLGFCQGENEHTQGVITFFYRRKEHVDEMYEKLSDVAEEEPVENENFQIYQFFAEDPEGRTLEFQTFLHPVDPYLGGEELLQGRRSVRDYREKKVPEETLLNIFETCRYAPTSRNSQSYYFVPIEDEDMIEFLSKRRGGNSAPIRKAPMAVAICCDPEETGRPKQDGDIAAYHFMLTAWAHGLGTCWIAAMDRDDVKEELNISEDHYVATVTPLGYPVKVPETPSRKEAEEFVKRID
ncbi:MAG: nitroreductase family protein [Candidatus Thermoplasmatota archaeon]|nr:nitroreductase family protein [Candidatus Thermoplasmatota archaeon]